MFFEYGSKNSNKFIGWKRDFKKFKKEFQITPPMLSDLKEIIAKHDVKFNQEAFDKDREYIKLLMKAEIARHLWDSEHFYMVRIMADNEVLETLEYFPKAKEIAMLNKWENRL